MNLPSSVKAPDADSPHSFRAESEAATAHKPLNLRSTSPAASHLPLTRSSSSSSLSLSLQLHHSSSLANSAALPGARRRTDNSPLRPPQDAAVGIAELVAPHVRQLYNTEVRSCGHPQRLYIKVPVGLSSRATERDRQGGGAPLRHSAAPDTEGTEAATPRHPTGSPVHAFAPPLAPVSNTTAEATPSARDALHRLPSPPSASPAALVSPYGTESTRVSLGSEPLPVVVTDGVRTPASSASASPAPAETAEMRDTKAHREDENNKQLPHEPQQQHQRRGGSERGLHPAPPLMEAQTLIAAPATFIHATSSILPSPHQRSVLGGTEERDIDVNAPVEDTTHHIASVHTSPAEVHLRQEGVPSAVTPSWAGREAAAATEGTVNYSPPASTASSVTSREELVGDDLDDKAGSDDGDDREVSGDVRSLPESEVEGWLLGASVQPSATAEVEQQERPHSLQLTKAETPEMSPSLSRSGEELQENVSVDTSRSPVDSSLPRKLSTLQHSDDDGDATVEAVVVELAQQQQSRFEDITVAERTIPPAATSYSPVELLEGEVEQALSALANPESSAVSDGSADNDAVDTVMPDTDALEGVGAAAAADVVANVVNTRQLVENSDVSDAEGDCAVEELAESADFSSANDFESAPRSVLADAVAGSEEVMEDVQKQQHRTLIPCSVDAIVSANSVAVRSSSSGRVLMPPPMPRAVPAEMTTGGYAGRISSSEVSRVSGIEADAEAHLRGYLDDNVATCGAARARDTSSLTTTLPPPPSVVHTTDMWRWPPQPASYDRRRHHHHQLRDGGRQQSWPLGALFQRRPVARDLLADVNAMYDEEDSGGKYTAWQPRSLAQGEGSDNRLLPQHASPSAAAAAAPPPSLPSVVTADTLVLAHRRIIADSSLNELVELEREGRRMIIFDMLQDREAVLQEEEVDFSILSLLSHRALTVAAAAVPRPAWVPPLSPSPLSPPTSNSISHSVAASALAGIMVPPPSGAEVEQLRRARALPGCFSLGIVSSALFADELLQREIVEGEEDSARTMLQRLCQCDADALNPCSIFMQEALARQRLMAMAQLELQQTWLLENSPAAGALELLSIGRELGLCSMMENDERRKVIEKAEQLGRQRLQELHWRGVAARLRQCELLRASIDVALRDAIEDALFDETQAREELRVEAIREMTRLLESASGTAVRGATRQRHQQRGTTPQRWNEKAHVLATSVAPLQPSARSAAADRESDAPVGKDDDSDWDVMAEVVSDFYGGCSAAGSDAEQPPVSASSLSSPTTTTVSSSLPISEASPEHHMATTAVTAAAAAAAAAANDGPALVAVDAPNFFEWDPTSNSASSPSTGSKARKPHPSSSQQQQHTSTSSPSLHLTHLTALTTTTTGNTTSVTTSSGGGTSQGKQAPATHASGNTTSDSRRSPTTVLPTEEEQQKLLWGHERVSPAEVSALRHALRCAEAAARDRYRASRWAEVIIEEGKAAPAWQHDHDSSTVVSAANLHDGVAESRSTPPPLSLPKQQHHMDSVDGVADGPRQPRTASHLGHASTTRGPLFINRHTIPCSLCRSPRRNYAALTGKYALQGEPQSSSPLLAAATISTSSPSTPSSCSPRPYAEGDVYAYHPQRTRHSKPARCAAFEEHPDPRVPWERPGEDIGDEAAVSSAEAMLHFFTNSAADAPASASDPTLQRPAREVFSARRSCTLSAAAPSHVPLAATVPLAPASSTAATHTGGPVVLEVIMDRRARGLSLAADVTVSPMSPSTCLSQSPTRARPPQAYAAPTAVWARYVQEQQLVRCVRDRGVTNDDDGERALYTSFATPVRDGGAATQVNPDQSGCSRRRWEHAEDYPGQHVSAPSAPLLITRLPLECGPGVWMSSPRDAHGAVHVVATTTPPCSRPAPAKLADAFSHSARTGDVVRLPTTVAELLQHPQHTRLPRPTSTIYVSPMKRLSCDLAEDRHALRQQPAPYRYVDVFYGNREQPPRRNAQALPPSTSVLVQPYSTSSSAFIAARCAAVREREIQQELRQHLQAPSPSQARRAPPSPSPARAGHTAASRRASSTKFPSALLTTAAAAAGDVEEVLTDESAEPEDFYFDDDDAFMPRSTAVASRVGRHRAVELRCQQLQQSCRGAMRPTARPPASPPAPLSYPQHRQRTSDAASGNHGDDGNRGPPPGGRRLPVPSLSARTSSFSLRRGLMATPLSSPLTGAVPAGAGGGASRPVGFIQPQHPPQRTGAEQQWGQRHPKQRRAHPLA
ncbi:hypothetical protein LPMP_030800 [Leishmania panamensis]|uniref:Uncharacterized protein n=1 Tax=Leishmania panamensis TaxID=5679 RepID=A0A088RHR8_LEIPA|nr:hypothetical protein LPMP_030800 [Leishmania panamensis]AIN95315.1 hypothetical protein LPMP_030800 [Leishmania panamensis]